MSHFKNLPTLTSSIYYKIFQIFNLGDIDDNKTSIIMKEILNLNEQILKHENTLKNNNQSNSTNQWQQFIRKKKDQAFEQMDQALNELKCEVKNYVRLFNQFFTNS